MKWWAGLLALTFLSGPATQDRREPLRLKWSLRKDDFARYKAWRFVPTNGGERVEENPSRLTGIFGYEIVEGTRYDPPFLDRSEIPLIIGFSLPEGPLKPGSTLKVERRLERGYDYAAALVRGDVRREDDVDGGVSYRVRAKIDPVAAANDGRRLPLTGDFEGSVRFDPARGVVTRVEFRCSITLNKTETSRFAERLELDRVLPYRYSGFQDEVDRAIDRGVAWIRNAQGDDGTWPGINRYKVGPTALALLACVKGESARDKPKDRRAVDWIVAQPLELVYEVGVCMLAVEAYFAAPDRSPTSLPKDLQVWMEKATRWLEDGILDGLWGYVSRTSDSMYVDLSNTQYAILGLYAAARCGVSLRPRVAERISRAFRNAQESNGPQMDLRLVLEKGCDNTRAGIRTRSRGWGYGKDGAHATGGMTMGGASSLEIVEPFLDSSKSAREVGLLQAAETDAWAWMAANWTVKANPGYGRTWTYYFLYALERAAMLGGVSHVNGHDWYYEGAAFLIANQTKDGGWTELGRDDPYLANVCFAVLFLKRSMMPRVKTP